MRHRQVAALLALAGTMLSLYLVLQRMGFLGPLVCGPGHGCETVQASRYSELFGIPVAAYGLGGYLVMMLIAMMGMQGSAAESPIPTRLLALFSGIGFLFTCYLTGLELFVIHAICRWCVGSAVIITLLFVTSLVGLRRRGGERREARVG